MNKTCFSCDKEISKGRIYNSIRGRSFCEKHSEREIKNDKKIISDFVKKDELWNE